MPSFRTGTVIRLLAERPGLQRVEVDLGTGGGAERAYVLTQLTGSVGEGDRVVVNTTAVELGLGTGGWHVVHWNLERETWSERGPGHIIKARYTSLQADVGSAEEHAAAELADVESVAGLPVVAVPLHSQVPAVAAAVRHSLPDARVAYVMTDGAALPLALSDLVADLRRTGLLDVTITCGHAFGGDFEAVSIYSALAVAHRLASADVAIVAMGPGIVGTGTRLGFSGIEVAHVLDATAALGGVPIACLRASLVDPRARHRGVSHHTLTTLRTACRSRVLVPFPVVGGEAERALLGDLRESGIAERHEVVRIQGGDALELLAAHGLVVTSMGRSAEEDPILFECAAAAGRLAADHCRGTGSEVKGGPERDQEATAS